MRPRWAISAISVVALHAAIATIVAIDPVAVNSPEQANLADGAKGPGVVRAQILLRRAHFSCGEIDGRFGRNLKKTIAAFQTERHLPVTEALDTATWVPISMDSAPALMDYTIRAAVLNGPVGPLTADMNGTSQLRVQGYPRCEQASGGH